MFHTWCQLSDEVQLALSQEALVKAAETIARHAEFLAKEMESGEITNLGGPEALRLLAAVVRVTGSDCAIGPPAGNA